MAGSPMVRRDGGTTYFCPFTPKALPKTPRHFLHFWGKSPPMIKKTRGNGVGVFVALFLITAASLPKAGASLVSSDSLTWYQTNPFVGGETWTYSTDPAFVSESNPTGSVLGNFNSASVDTTLVASFDTQTLLNGGESVSFSLNVRRSVVATQQSFLSIGLGYDGGTPFTQDYIAPALPPTGNDITFMTDLNSAIYFTDTNVHNITILISRWEPAPTFFRRQVWVDGVEIALVDDGFVGAGFNPTSQFNQVSIGFNWSSNEGPNLISAIPAAIPEPSTYALLGGAAALLIVGARRSRKLVSAK
jgi:hypothetical protein